VRRRSLARALALLVFAVAFLALAALAARTRHG
jgi:hypothetical protein